MLVASLTAEALFSASYTAHRCISQPTHRWLKANTHRLEQHIQLLVAPTPQPPTYTRRSRHRLWLSVSHNTLQHQLLVRNNAPNVCTTEKHEGMRGISRNCCHLTAPVALFKAFCSPPCKRPCHSLVIANPCLNGLLLRVISSPELLFYIFILFQKVCGTVCHKMPLASSALPRKPY